MRSLVSAFLIFVIVLSSACLGEETPTKAGTSVTPSQDLNSISTSSSGQILKLKLGETAETSTLAITVHNAFKTSMVPEEYTNDWADPGKIFVVVDVEAKNIGSSQEEYVALSDFSASDSTGMKYSVLYLSGDKYFRSTTLYPGERTEGWIVIEVPKYVKTINIKYNFGVLTTKIASWELDMANLPIKEPQIKIERIDVKYKYDTILQSYIITQITAKIKNQGDLPVHIGVVEVKYGSDNWKDLDYLDNLLMPGEEKVIQANDYEILDQKLTKTGIKLRLVDTSSSEEHVLAEAEYP